MYFGWRHPTYLYYLHIGATIGVIPIFYSNRGQIGVEHSCLHLDCSRFWVYSGVNPYFYNGAIFLVPGLYTGVFQTICQVLDHLRSRSDYWGCVRLDVVRLDSGWVACTSSYPFIVIWYISIIIWVLSLSRNIH